MNEDCPFCRYDKSEENCRGCFEGSNYRPKQTNADRIRAMTDEELAKELSFIGDCRCPDGGECGHENGCLWCWQNWLKQEAVPDA